MKFWHVGLLLFFLVYGLMILGYRISWVWPISIGIIAIALMCLGK